MQSKLFSLDGFLELAFLLLYNISWKTGFLWSCLTQGSTGSRDMPYIENPYFCRAAIGCIEEMLMSPENNVILNFVTRRKVSLMHVIMCGSTALWY